MTAYLPNAVAEALRDRIEGLAPRPTYAQDATAWVRSSFLLVPEYEPDTAAHLRFFIDDRALVQGGTPQAYTLGCEGVTVRAPVTVSWLMRMRPLSTGLVADNVDAVTDWDAAAIAGCHLAGWLLAPWHDYDLIALQPAFLDRRPVLGGEWLAVDLRLSVSYTLDIG